MNIGKMKTLKTIAIRKYEAYDFITPEIFTTIAENENPLEVIQMNDFRLQRPDTGPQI